jgi:hypothetical protein
MLGGGTAEIESIEAGRLKSDHVGNPSCLRAL